MEVQGNGIFVFPRKGLGLEGTEVIPGKLAALLFVSQEQEESEGAQMLPAELVWWSHRMKPPASLLVIHSQHKAKAPPKGDTAKDSIAPQGHSISAFPMEDPPKSHPTTSALLEHCRGGISTEPSLTFPPAFRGKERKAKVLVGKEAAGTCWRLE